MGKEALRASGKEPGSQWQGLDPALQWDPGPCGSNSSVPMLEGLCPLLESPPRGLDTFLGVYGHHSSRTFPGGGGLGEARRQAPAVAQAGGPIFRTLPHPQRMGTTSSEAIFKTVIYRCSHRFDGMRPRRPGTWQAEP